MKVRISDIPADGLEINDSLELERLNARMLEGGQDSGIIFTSAPTVKLKITRTIGGAEAKGKVRAKYKQSCGRCLDEVEREMEQETSLIISPKTEGDSEGSKRDDEIGIVFYEGESVDLEEILQENLIISLSIYWSPPVNANGACELCGLISRTSHDGDKISEEKVKFGDLLKKALEREH